MRVLTTAVALSTVLASAQASNLRASRNLSSFPAKSQALQEAIEECGANFGDGSALDLHVGDGSGNCPDNQVCNNFYTLNNLLTAIDDFNQGRSIDDQFPSEVLGSRCLTIAAFLGQTYFESAQYRACKEHTSPCPAWSANSCSGGQATDYTPSKQSWDPKIVPGTTNQTGPAMGCTDFWGNKQTDPANCWFGRGAIQITWLANYALYLPEFINNPDQICEVGQVAWKGSVAFWQANKARFTGSCESATLVPNPAQCDDSCKKARCDEQEKIVNALKPATLPPTPPPPPFGTHTVTQSEASQGPWGIANILCPGQGNQYATVLCTPAPYFAGSTISYNCNGC